MSMLTSASPAVPALIYKTTENIVRWLQPAQYAAHAALHKTCSTASRHPGQIWCLYPYLCLTPKAYTAGIDSTRSMTSRVAAVGGPTRPIAALLACTLHSPALAVCVSIPILTNMPEDSGRTHRRNIAIILLITLLCGRVGEYQLDYIYVKRRRPHVISIYTGAVLFPKQMAWSNCLLSRAMTAS